MCYEPGLVQLQRRLLSNPLNVSRILRQEPGAREKVIIYFQWLEKTSKSFVWTVVENILRFSKQIIEVPDEHLLGFNAMIHLGKFFIESGWYAEAIVVLNIAKNQTRGHPFKLLQATKVLVQAEIFSNRYEAAFSTIAEIHILVERTCLVSMSLTAEIRCSLAVAHFEVGEFDASYQQGLLALQLLGENICPHETTIGTFRQLSKTCLALKRPYQAKLMITQAVSWAWHNFGSSSRIYAETLEDYAFYLLMLDAYEDAVKLTTEAKNIYYKLYGHLGLQPQLAQGNLPFRLYLESQAFNELGSIDEYIDFISDYADNQRKPQIIESDDRQLVAINRIRPMMAVRDLCRGLSNSLSNVSIEDVQPQYEINEIRRLFFKNFA
ncbi:hypothetical protein RP20_CCG010563 [Aedes albopictus]|nr:hypothetical protein RP20_CCG010563 [Aedes albopictus]